MMWKCGSFEFDTRKPVIMGILNVTPDSFSDGGTHSTPEAALAWARRERHLPWPEALTLACAAAAHSTQGTGGSSSAPYAADLPGA